MTKTSTSSPVDQLGRDLAADHTLAKARGEVADVSAPLPGQEVEGKIEEAADKPLPTFIGGYESFDEARDKNKDMINGDLVVVNEGLCRFNADGTFSIILSNIVDEYSLPADHTEQFAADLDAIERTVLSAEFESGGLLANFRDTMLQMFKGRPKQWSQMSQAEQRDLAKQIEAQATTIIRKVTRVIAEGDEISVVGKLESYSHKGSFDLKISAASDVEAAVSLFNMQGHEVVIRSADAARFLEAAEAATDPDQVEMFAEGTRDHDDEQPAEPARVIPEDDSDLAGDYDDDDAPVETPDSTTDADPAPETEVAAAETETAAANDEPVAGKPKPRKKRTPKSDENKAEEVKVSGTGADAIAAMNAAAAEEKAAEAETGQEPGEYEARSNPDDDVAPQADYVGPKAPADPEIGESWLNTETEQVKYWHGKSWYVGKPEIAAPVASDDDEVLDDIDE